MSSGTANGPFGNGVLDPFQAAQARQPDCKDPYKLFGPICMELSNPGDASAPSPITCGPLQDDDGFQANRVVLFFFQRSASLLHTSLAWIRPSVQQTLPMNDGSSSATQWRALQLNRFVGPFVTTAVDTLNNSDFIVKIALGPVLAPNAQKILVAWGVVTP